jgi:purine-binding chemotaxis protein CheW
MSKTIDLQHNLPPDLVDILRRRSQQLASPVVERDMWGTIDPKKNRRKYLCFQLMHQRYALPLEVVREVVGLKNVVLVPGAPAHVVGISRLRGEILALINLHIYWNPDIKGHMDCDMAIVVEQNGIDFGLICTAVEGLFEPPPEDIKPTPPNLSTELSACLQGVAEREIMLLNINKLLARPGFLINPSATQE